jgi:hypothetical protein
MMKTVKDTMEVLRKARNKDAKVIYRVNNVSYEATDAKEAITEDDGVVKLPSLGENPNSVAIILTPVVRPEKASAE